MNGRLQSLAMLALVATGGWPAGSLLADELRITANTPDVTVSTRTTSRNFMRLPALDFAFELEVSCSASLNVRGVSLSIADTRIALTEAQLADPAARQLSLTIPAGQIPPVRIENFCLADQAQTEAAEQVEIPAILSVQGSLVCANEDESRITYASTPLNVVVNCRRSEVSISTD